MANKFKEGDTVTANYGDYVENGVVTKVVEIQGTTPDYYVRFGNRDKDFDIFNESELEANPNG